MSPHPHLFLDCDGVLADFDAGAKKLLGLSGTAVSITKGVINIVVGAITITFMTFFMLLEGPQWMERFYSLLPDTSRPRAERICQQIYRTVETHLTHVFRKLGLTARSDLAAAVLTAGSAPARRGS